MLRGPQPILFGKNAVAGAVNMVAARPTQRASKARCALSYDMENNDTIGTLCSPARSPTRSARDWPCMHRNADGYVDNITLDRDEPQRDELAAA